MPARYDKSGIQLLYPENWRVVEEQTGDWPHGVTLQSPGGALWEVEVYPSHVELTDLIAQFLQAMRAEYEELEAQTTSEDICEQPAVGYDLSFFCLDFLVTCQVRCLRSGHRTLLLSYQAESREFDRQERVFAAITHSLLMG
jgi:hypothetical protein